MRWCIYLLMMCVQHQFLFSSRESATHIRVISHQETLPYNSYEKETGPRKAFFKAALYGCTSDEATYILAKDSMYGGPTADCVEACWEEFQENGKTKIVQKHGVSSGLRNLDQTVIKTVPFVVLYGFRSRKEAFDFALPDQNAREE